MNVIYFVVNDKEILVVKEINGINYLKNSENCGYVLGDKKSVNRILVDNV